MRQRCEVCENFRPEAETDARAELVEVAFDVRPVVLCKGHARIAKNSGVTSFDELRDLYGSGRRSFVPRRGRSSTPRADEQRRLAGRRATDVR
jgi:hypothetical protein